MPINTVVDLEQKIKKLLITNKKITSATIGIFVIFKTKKIHYFNFKT